MGIIQELLSCLEATKGSVAKFSKKLNTPFPPVLHALLFKRKCRCIAR
jgi:hypothetical protein